MNKIKDAINSKLDQIRKGPYDAGNWAQSEQELNEMVKTLKIGQNSVEVMIGWNLWKQGKKGDACTIWNGVYLTDVLESDRLSALCGLAMYNAEEGQKKMAVACISQIKERLTTLDEANIRFTITLNSLGIALAKIEEYEEAEKILKEAIRINAILAENEETYQDAVHQGSKNRYNLGSLVYQKLRKREDAFRVFSEAVSGYEEVGAETDLAALFYQLAMTSGEDDKTDRLNYLVRSAKLWFLHQDDDMKRWTDAVKNIDTEVGKSCQGTEKERQVREIVVNIEKEMTPILERRRKQKEQVH